VNTPDGFDLLERMRAAAGHIPEVAEFLREAERWIEDSTAASLQVYLRFPDSPARRRLYLRNKWLTKAAREIKASGPTDGANKLRQELDAFLTRGPWFMWREEERPPKDATPLREALFFAVKFNGGQLDLSGRWLQDIVGSVWRRNF